MIGIVPHPLQCVAVGLNFHLGAFAIRLLELFEPDVRLVDLPCVSVTLKLYGRGNGNVIRRHARSPWLRDAQLGQCNAELGRQSSDSLARPRVPRTSAAWATG